MMLPIEPPDSHYLLAASGWLDLGCPEEALAELNGLSRENRHHPDALELQWLIHAEQQDWTAALGVAEEVVVTAPERPTGWLHRAYATRRVLHGGLQKAWDLLLPAHEKFPEESVIPYNLACYACQMGHLDESRRWLKIAFGADKRGAIKTMALKDDDLRALWGEIRAM